MLIVDCDVHVRWKSKEELAPHFDEPFRTHFLNGRRAFTYSGYFNQTGPRRRDALPPSGGSAGSDPHFTASHLLDAHEIRYGVLVGEPSQLGVSVMTDTLWANAVSRAYNNWLMEHWFTADNRFVGSIFVAAQDPSAAAREIERVADHPQFVQVIMGAGSRVPYGNPFYDPIYQAAERHNLPIAIHPGTEGAGISSAPSAAGYPSHYIEWHTCIPGTTIAHLVSFLCEGVFEKFPRLRLVLIESGISWFPGLMWRLDKNWKGLRQEVPWVKRKPSEYAYDHVYLTTQPIEEPNNSEFMRQLLNMFPSSDMLMFASDYPHWDFDDPRYVLRYIPPNARERVLGTNALALYGLATS